MTRITAIVASIGLTCLSACTTVQERQSSNSNFDYVQEPEAKIYQVPDGLHKPVLTDDYTIPQVGPDAPAGLVGEKVTIMSPALVLPLVSGSHIEEGMKEATVWFDQIDDSQPLDTTIWNSLINYLEEQGIGVVNFDKEKQTLVTDWMIIETTEEDGSWYSWTTTERSVGRRFEFNLEVKPHGRTAALHATLKDYLETYGEEVIAELDAEQQRRNEVDVLNQVIGHYEHQIRVADARRLREIRRGLSMELGFDRNGDSAYMVDGEYDVVWPRLLLVLRKLGFNVKDLDKSTGLLFVTYGQAEESWWSGLFSSNDDELNLDKDDYRFQVNKAGNKTSITLMDEDSEPFEVTKVTELFDSFARVMAANDLDI